MCLMKWLIEDGKTHLAHHTLKKLEFTHLDGTLLDHVYLHKTFEHDELVMSVVNNLPSRS